MRFPVPDVFRLSGGTPLDGLELRNPLWRCRRHVLVCI